MDYKNIIIIILIIALIAVLYYFLTKKSKNPAENYNYLTVGEYKHRYVDNKKDPNNMNNDFKEKIYDEGNYTKFDGKTINTTIINDLDKNTEITNSSMAKNIQALTYKMDSQVNFDQYKDFIENQNSIEGKYNTLYAPEDVFQTIIQTDPSIPTMEQITDKFKECIKDQNNTVQECLTSSSSGLYPGLAKSLCQEYYDPLSPICNKIAIDQMKQMNTSSRSGPA
jgi:hypothetical protein